MKTLILIFFVSFGTLTLSSCSIKAPYDYYYKLALIEKTGESIRSDTGRKIGKKFEPLLAQQDFPITIDSTDDDAYVETPPEKPIQEAINRLKEKMPPITGVDLKEDQLSSLLKKLGVNMVKVETIDGRLVGGKNSIRVSFMPKNELDEGKLMVEFSTICGAVYGFDKKQTVDVVTAFAEKRETLLPYIIMQANIKDFIDLSEGKISQKDWISRITVKKL